LNLKCELLPQHNSKHQPRPLAPSVVLDIPEDRLPVMLDCTEIMFSGKIDFELELIELLIISKVQTNSFDPPVPSIPNHLHEHANDKTLR